MSIKKWDDFNKINESISSTLIDESIVEDIKNVKSELNNEIVSYISSILDNYRAKIDSIISEKIPDNTYVLNGNGEAYLYDINNNQIDSSQHVLYSEDSENKDVLSEIANLQYLDVFLKKVVGNVENPIISGKINSDKNSDNE